MSESPLSLSDADAQMTAPGQMFETDRITINGVEMTIWKHAPANLRHVFDLSLVHATQEFMVYEGQRFTFEEHYRIASTFAHRLVDLGITKGDRVAIIARNLPQWITSFWGAMICGAVVAFRRGR